MKKTRCALCYAVLAVCFALLLAVSVGTGSAALSPHEILRILLLREGAGTAAYNVLLKIRLPRVLAAAVMGGTLSVSGFLLQTFFRNPIAGPYVLGVSSGASLGAVIALVDALPVLGTGTVLVPWAVICFLQGEGARAIGLLGVYAVVTLSRSMLEPKLVGRHLGLDPLVTLMALYVGYKLWGVGGMIFAPLLAVTIMQVTPGRERGDTPEIP